MDNRSNRHEGSVANILRGTLEGTETLLVINPAADTVAELVDVVAAREDDRPEVRLLADNRALKDAFEDFLVASSAADLIEQGVLTVRSGDLEGNTLLVADDSVFALVVLDDHVAALGDENDAFVTAVEDAYGSRWDDASEFQLRTPAISRVRETLEADIGTETREDFDRVLESLEATRDDGIVLDEVIVSLLVAAKNEVLLYDISRWGEDVGIASKATFSRTKTRLEDHGLIDTEKVPIDVGRPRLRLQFGDDRLGDADVDELVRIVSDELAD
jgi:hypothetical protein